MQPYPADFPHDFSTSARYSGSAKIEIDVVAFDERADDFLRSTRFLQIEDQIRERPLCRRGIPRPEVASHHVTDNVPSVTGANIRAVQEHTG